jgi:N-glycosylase/DNA lyase
MNKILCEIDELKKSDVKSAVDKRLKDFKSNKSFFSELCFCILTANFQAEKSIRIQKEIGDGFETLPEKSLAKRLRELGHRFPNTRARYIVEARKHKAALLKNIKSMKEDELRGWIAENIKGLGYKEASHFLRNIGFCSCAIIDFHIVDALEKHGLAKKPKTLAKKNYLEIEGVLKNIGAKTGLNLAELDLYLWYSETGKVLK